MMRGAFAFVMVVQQMDGSSHNVIDDESETREARCETERDVIKAEVERVSLIYLTLK